MNRDITNFYPICKLILNLKTSLTKIDIINTKLTLLTPGSFYLGGGGGGITIHTHAVFPLIFYKLG